MQTHSNFTYNHFDSKASDRLWAYLDGVQKQLALRDPFISTLPESKEVRALAVMVVESLVHAGKPHYVQLLYFDVKDSKEPTNGVFKIRDYQLLTEHFKEYPLAQTLTQDLTELVEWMID